MAKYKSNAIRSQSLKAQNSKLRRKKKAFSKKGKHLHGATTVIGMNTDTLKRMDAEERIAMKKKRNAQIVRRENRGKK